jgi:hypothetical protein
VKVQVEYALVLSSVVHGCATPHGTSALVRNCSEQAAVVGGKTAWPVGDWPAVTVLGSEMVKLRVE